MSDYAVSFQNANSVIANFDDHDNGLVLRGRLIDPYLPPVQHTARDNIGLDGATLLQSRMAVKEVTVPVGVFGSPGDEIRDRMRALAVLLNPNLGSGALIVERDGNQRQLNCSYQDGFGAEMIVNDWGLHDWWEGGLTFVAFDPHWYDTATQSNAWTVEGDPTPFFPIFPLVLGSSTVLGDSTITVDSEVPVYPIWTIDGPGSDIVIENLTTGRLWQWDGTLDEGEQLVVNTRPGSTLVEKDGSNAFADLSLFDLWPFVPGTNELALEVSGASSVTTVTASWQNAFLGP